MTELRLGVKLISGIAPSLSGVRRNTCYLRPCSRDRYNHYARRKRWLEKEDYLADQASLRPSQHNQQYDDQSPHMSSKTVLVTGGNTGLGLEIIRALYQSSSTYNLLLGSRSLEKAEAAISAVKSEEASTSSAIIEPIQIDIEDDESISRAFETVEKKFGHLDILVNNAGTSLCFAPCIGVCMKTKQGRCNIRPGSSRGKNRLARSME